jgi:hypothetical protein
MRAKPSSTYSITLCEMSTNGITVFTVYVLARFGTFGEGAIASGMLSGSRRL